jgi:hypothetical protein
MEASVFGSRHGFFSEQGVLPLFTVSLASVKSLVLFEAHCFFELVNIFTSRWYEQKIKSGGIHNQIEYFLPAPW